MKIGRMIAGFVAATLVTLILASAVHTHFTLQGLQTLGVEVPPALAWQTAKGDFVGLGPALGAVITIALLLGFIIAGVARRFIALPRPVAFAIAGAAAFATALWLMHYNFEITPIGSARTWTGFLSLAAAGALGGLIFASVSRQRAA